MSVYSVKRKGWRYDFTNKGIRYTEAWFKTKTEARQAEAKKREEVKNPKPETEAPIDMDFLELINLKLDDVKNYNSDNHYKTYLYLARRWIKKWRNLLCSEISADMVEKHHLQRKKISADTANQDLRYLRAAFNWGIQKKYIQTNPTKDLKFFPVEKKIKHFPPSKDIDKVIAVADSDTQDYLWTIRETLARINEINRLLWEDINFEGKYLVLYTRKKRNGDLTPRKIPMTQKLYKVLKHRFDRRDKKKPWVFWHRYWSQKKGDFCEGPYQNRKRMMQSLCKKAGVKYFRFHPIRHSGASIMDCQNVPLGAIQRILGHENRKTTEIYLHSIGGVEREAIAVFERSRQKSHMNSHTDDN